MEVAGVPMDQTPGTKQSLRLMVELLHSQRNLTFWKRVLEYHALIDRLANAGDVKL